MYIDLSKLNDGFSSKLKIISFFLAVITIRKFKKKLFIYEKKNKECPYLFTDYLKIKNFKVIKLNKRPKTKILFNPYNYSSELSKLKKENMIQNVTNRKFNLIAETLHGHFIPNKKVQRLIEKINLPKKFVAIHIRSTDRVIFLKNFLKKIQFSEMIFDFQIKKMIKNINYFIKLKSKTNQVFICSDDKKYKEKFFKELKKNNFVFSNISKFNINKFRQTRGIDFITELFCLSKSQIIISTVGGAVTKSAYLISKKRIKVYRWINVMNLHFLFRVVIFIIFNLKKFKKIFIK